MSNYNSIAEWIPQITGPGLGYVQELNLASKATIDLGNADQTLICLEGEIWLTRYGDPEDHIVGCCQRFAVKKGDKALAYALRKSRVRLVRSGAGQVREASLLRELSKRFRALKDQVRG